MSRDTYAREARKVGTAYLEGLRSGRLDAAMGHVLEVSYYSINSLNEYVREYARGYRDGVRQYVTENES